MSKISIAIVTYNRAPYICAAIASVVCQTNSDWELIIVDDASTDNTKLKIDNCVKGDQRVKYIKNYKNLGISESRNVALQAASGKYMAILDSDDIWADNTKLQKQYDFLEKNEEYVLVGGAVIEINETGHETNRYKNPTTDVSIRKGILLRNPFINSSVMYKRDEALKCGGYEKYTVGEDYDLFLKLGQKGKLFNLSDYLVKYRKHDSGITWSKRVLAAQDHLNIISKFKHVYPNYFLALIKGYMRLLLTKILML